MVELVPVVNPTSGTGDGNKGIKMETAKLLESALG